MLKVRVRCSFEVTVEFPDEMEDRVKFMIEENGCPGTGMVGAIVNPFIDEGRENSTCWACAIGATNTIVSVEKVCG